MSSGQGKICWRNNRLSWNDNKRDWDLDEFFFVGCFDVHISIVRIIYT